MATININKGLIGLEDLYAGDQDTFSRRKSDGVNQTITKLTAQALGSHNIFNAKEYGAMGNSTNGSDGTDDTDALHAMFDAVYANGGGMVIIPTSLGSSGNTTHYRTSFHIEIPGNCTVIWEGGSYFLREPGTALASHPTLPNRGEVVGMRRTRAYTGDQMLINPLIDGNGVGLNGLGVGSGQEITDGPNPITKFAERLHILGGHITNCYRDDVGGGQAITSQQGSREHIYEGIHITNCHTAMSIAGQPQTTQDEWVREIIFNNITVRDCGIMISLHGIGGTAQENYEGGSKTHHASFSNIIARNVGKSDAYTNYAIPYNASNGVGVISSIGGGYVHFSNIDVANEDSYPTIGGFMVGKMHHCQITDCSFVGNCDAVFDGTSPDGAAYGTWDTHPEFYWRDNLVNGFKFDGVADYIFDSAAWRTTGKNNALNLDNHFMNIVCSTPTIGIMSHDFMHQNASFIDVTDHDTGFRRIGRADYVAGWGTAKYTGTLSVEKGIAAVTGTGVDNTQYAVGDIIIIEDSTTGVRKPYLIATVDGDNFTIENPNTSVVGYQGTTAGAERFYYVNNDFTTAPATYIQSALKHSFNSLSFVQSSTANRMTLLTQDESNIVVQHSTGALHQFREGFMPPSHTTTARDLLDIAEGVIIYNTTTNKLNVSISSGVGAVNWEAITSA